jgi:uncharacterized protein (DUF1330 family)
MAAYLIAEIVEVMNPAKMEEYRKRVPAVVERFGGRYLAASSSPQTLEGTWRPGFAVMIEFPSRERLMAWYDSKEYAELKALRQAAVISSLVAVDGLS